MAIEMLDKTILHTDCGAELQNKVQDLLMTFSTRTGDVGRHEVIDLLLGLLDDTKQISRVFREWKRLEQELMKT